MDPITIAAGIGAAASAIGGYFSYRGQEDANKANLQAAREQMEFQERMSNTSWQRGIADMRAAGMNPMLAFNKGGAPVPGGASANFQNTMANVPQAIASAVQSIRLKSELDNLDADAKLKTANAANIMSQLPATSAKSAYESEKYNTYTDAIKIGKGVIHYDQHVNSAKAHASSVPQRVSDYIKKDIERRRAQNAIVKAAERRFLSPSIFSKGYWKDLANKARSYR